MRGRRSGEPGADLFSPKHKSALDVWSGPGRVERAWPQPIRRSLLAIEENSISTLQPACENLLRGFGYRSGHVRNKILLLELG